MARSLPHCERITGASQQKSFNAPAAILLCGVGISPRKSGGRHRTPGELGRGYEEHRRGQEDAGDRCSEEERIGSNAGFDLRRAHCPDTQIPSKPSDRTGGHYDGFARGFWVGFRNGHRYVPVKIVGDLGGLKIIRSVRALTQSWLASGIYHPMEMNVEVRPMDRFGFRSDPVTLSRATPQVLPRCGAK